MNSVKFLGILILQKDYAQLLLTLHYEEPYIDVTENYRK